MANLDGGTFCTVYINEIITRYIACAKIKAEAAWCRLTMQV